MILSTDRIEQIRALVAELREEAEHEHCIALEIDPHTVNERGEKCPFPTTPLEQRLPSRVADALEALAALTAHAPVAAIPEGYVLVPKEPTQAMQDAAANTPGQMTYADVYRAMIATLSEPRNMKENENG